MIGVILIVWEISIYRKTIIDIYVLILLIVTVGTITFRIDYKNYLKTYEMSKTTGYVLAWLQNILSWGFIACTIFMASNFYFTENDVRISKYEIIEKASMTGSKGNRNKRKPLIRINYNGSSKELIFSHKFYNQMDSYKSVTLETTTGLFGFEVILNQTLNK